MLSITYFESVVLCPPVNTSEISTLSASANSAYAVCISPLSGASETPPVNDTVDSAAVKLDVKVVPAPLVPQVVSLAG